jgi:hypothetical protein
MPSQPQICFGLVITPVNSFAAQKCSILLHGLSTVGAGQKQEAQGAFVVSKT